MILQAHWFDRGASAAHHCGALSVISAIFYFLSSLAACGQTTDTYTAGVSEWTVPVGVSEIRVQAWGGGGAGGGTVGGVFARGGGGGGGGGYAEATLRVIPGQNFTIVVASSTPGTAGDNGAAGVPSFVGPDRSPANAFVLAAGGGGGTAGSDAITHSSGGAGGAAGASRGDITLSGETGGAGGNVFASSGGGGASPEGGGAGGAPIPSFQSGNGNPGQVPGGGGGGARTSLSAAHSGGAGAAGRVLISYIIHVPDAVASTITASLPSAGVVADGASSAELVVTVRDASGNPVAGAEVVFAITSGEGSLDAENAVTGADGTARVAVRSTSAGPVEVTGYLGAEGPAVGSVTVEFVAGAAADARYSTVTAKPTTIIADGIDESIISIRLRDADGNELQQSDVAVFLTTTGGTLATTAGVTDATGRFETILTSEQAGSGTVLAFLGTSSAGPQIGSVTVIFLQPAIDEEFVREVFREESLQFITRRMDRILSSEPLSYGLDQRRQAGGTRRAAVSVGADPDDVSISFKSDILDGRWHIWTEGERDWYREDTSGPEGRRGMFSLVYWGADFLVNERLAVGLMLQADRMRERVQPYPEFSSTGWTIGPYLAAEIAKDLFLNAHLRWGEILQ